MNPSRSCSNRFRRTILLLAILALLPVLAAASDHPTSNPYETRPTPDGRLPYLIIPTPDGLKTDKDVMVEMPDGVRLAVNVYRPVKPGKYAVVLSMTPYGKDQTPPFYRSDGIPPVDAYAPFLQRVHAHVPDMGHMKISLLTPWEGPDPAYWVMQDYVVVIVDQRGGFKSGGKPPDGNQQGDDLYNLIEWAARQEWSTGNVGMIGVSALAMNQYRAASHVPPAPHLKAIIPWEGLVDRYRESSFWGGIPETNFSFAMGPFKRNLETMPPDQAAKAWTAALDPVANQKLILQAPALERITVPALVCASWTDKGLHTYGTFDVFRKISSRDKWLYTHGGSKWERFYSDDALATQKRFFDYFLKGVQNNWPATPRVRLEVRETREEYQVRSENEWPLARTQYTKFYLNAATSTLNPQPAAEARLTYNSTQGGQASFGITFDRDTELTGYMKVKLWVAAEDADDMDLFVVARKFAGPCDLDTPTCKALEVATKGRIARGNQIFFRGQNGYGADVAARGQMRVSQRELDEKLSTSWFPVQKFQGEKRLTPGEIVPIEIMLLPSSTLFRKGETLTLQIQGYTPTDHPMLWYDWLVNRGRHTIYTGGKYDSYLQLPVIPLKAPATPR